MSDMSNWWLMIDHVLVHTGEAGCKVCSSIIRLLSHTLFNSATYMAQHFKYKPHQFDVTHLCPHDMRGIPEFN
jgi:hypothetical protein